MGSTSIGNRCGARSRDVGTTSTGFCTNIRWADYVAGGAWIAGALQFVLVQIAAGLAWATPYSWTRYNISDLGAVSCGMGSDGAGYVCSPWHGFVNASFAAEGVAISVGVLLSWRAWNGGLGAHLARGLLIVAGLSYVLVALEPEDVNLNLHVLGAFAGFVCGILGIFLAGSLRGVARLAALRWFSLVLGTFAIGAFVLYAGRHDLGLGPGGMERVVVYPVQLWTVVAGIFLLLLLRRPLG